MLRGSDHNPMGVSCLDITAILINRKRVFLFISASDERNKFITSKGTFENPEVTAQKKVLWSGAVHIHFNKYVDQGVDTLRYCGLLVSIPTHTMHFFLVFALRQCLLKRHYAIF